MNNNNNINVSFACGLCETSFDGFCDFIEHKKTNHFQEFQKTKCIVFKEQIFSDSSLECASVLPSPMAHIVIKTETLADTPDTNMDTNNADCDSIFEQEGGSSFCNIVVEPNIEAMTFKEEISQNPVVLLKRLSSKKICLLTSRNPSCRNSSIVKPKLSGQDDLHFISHRNHDDTTIPERNNEPFPTPLFEIVCKQENTTSLNCSEAFTNEATLTNHMEHYQDFVPQKYGLKTVAAECKDDNEITHLITDEDIIPRPFKCPEPNCPKRFRYEESVNHHFASHTGLKPFKCPELNCGKECTYKFALKLHSKVHKDKSVFRRGHRRKSNVEENSDEIFGLIPSKKFKCPEPNCESVFSSTAGLQSHLHRHSDSKLFKCPVSDCGKTFKQRGSLYNHRAFHADVIPFTCPYPLCGKAYKFKYSRNQHMKRHQ